MFTYLYSGDLEVSGTSISISDEGSSTGASNEVAIALGGSVKGRKDDDNFSINSKGYS